jgi:hypothetical protein
MSHADDGEARLVEQDARTRRSDRSQETAGSTDTAPAGRYEPIAVLSRSIVHPSPITEPAGAPVDPASDALFDGLTASELAMLLNRYEQLARSDLGSLTDDRTAIELEVWHDFVEGPASSYIDRIRTSAEDRWIQLRSGEVICKPPGADSWIWIRRSDCELPEPFVIVSILSSPEPIRPTLVISNSEHAGARPTPELNAISKHFE